MKKSLMSKLSLGFVVLLLTFIVGCSGEKTSNKVGEDKEVKTIKVANYFAEDHPQNIALREKFKPLVEEKSGGTLKVEIYPNSQLGAEQEFYDGVRNGTIEMGIPGMIMQSTIEKLGVPEWPFLFENYVHVKKVFNGPIGNELVEDLESVHGVKALAWSANGFRMFSSNKTLASYDDFKGLRLRMPNIPNYIELGKRLGANVTPLAISEVFTGLEQKVIDGQDNPIATLKASGWYEVQSDVLESNHMFSPNLYIINLNFWNGLTPEQQEIIQESATISADYEFKLMEQSFESDKQFLVDKGIKFTIPDNDYRQSMMGAVEPMYEEFYKKYDWAKDLVERIRAEAK